MTSAPIILVPGFWLGAWAWDEVAAALRADGHDVTALTLPGLESVDDRPIHHHDVATTSTRSATRSGRRGLPSCSPCTAGPALAGYGASDRVPELIAAMVYVDSAPAKGAMDPDFDGGELPLPSREELEAGENLDGLTEEQLETFRRRAVPEPGGVHARGGRADRTTRVSTCRAR